MKRRAHYNVGKGAGGGKYSHNIPDKRRSPRLRPAVGHTKRNRLFDFKPFYMKQLVEKMPGILLHFVENPANVVLYAGVITFFSAVIRLTFS